MSYHKICFSLLSLFTLCLYLPQQVIGQNKFGPDPFIVRSKFHGDVISAGTGLRAAGSPTASGTITISGIPPGSIVDVAYLYWAILGDGSPPPGSNAGKLNGKQIVGTLIGSDVSPCWDPPTIHSYFENVTNLVTGNGTYSLSDFVNSGSSNISPSIEGASLIVVFANPSLPLKDVTIYHGCATVDQSSNTTVIQGFEAASPPTDADLVMVVADGQSDSGDFADELLVNNVSLGSNNFDGDEGFLWDNDQFDITALIPGNSTSIPVTLSSKIDPNTKLADCLTWVAAALSVSSAPFKDPLHETIQACALNADWGCLIGYSTLFPYIGRVIDVGDFVVDLCDAAHRISIGDTIAGVIKTALMGVETPALILSIPADASVIGIPVQVLGNLFLESVDCFESKLHELLVELCGGYTKCTMRTIKQGFDAIEVNALGIFVGSPVSLEVFDEHGKRLFVDGVGSVNAEIPSSWLYRLEDSRQLALINNPEGQYKILVTGLPEAAPGDTFNLGIVLSGDRSLEITYENVPTQAGSKATLAVGKQTTDFSLQVDVDGDGNVDITVPPAPEGPPIVQKPMFVYPVNGQTLDYAGSYLFQVEPIITAQGFLWGFFQNGVLVWENLRDEGMLSGNEYGIHPGTTAHSKFAPGSVQVWVRALIDGQWTDATTITISLQ